MKRRKTFAGELLRHAGNAIDELMMACPSEEEQQKNLEELIHESKMDEEIHGIHEYIVDLDNRISKMEHQNEEHKIISFRPKNK